MPDPDLAMSDLATCSEAWGRAVARALGEQRTVTALRLDSHEARIAGMQMIHADHERRIAALEERCPKS